MAPMRGLEIGYFLQGRDHSRTFIDVAFSTGDCLHLAVVARSKTSDQMTHCGLNLFFRLEPFAILSRSRERDNFAAIHPAMIMLLRFRVLFSCACNRSWAHT